MNDTSFPSLEWSFSLKRNSIVKITHPSGVEFHSPVLLNKDERLKGLNQIQYHLTEKDSFLLSYLIDYFIHKSKFFKLDQEQSIVLSSNLFCSYRFRMALGEKLFSNEKEEQKGYRKFGEHWVYLKDNSKLSVFVIGHGKNTLYAVTLTAKLNLIQYELLELPRDYFYRENISPSQNHSEK